MTDPQRDTLRALSKGKTLYQLNVWERKFVANLLSLAAIPRRHFELSDRQSTALADLAARRLPPPQPPPDPSTE